MSQSISNNKLHVSLPSDLEILLERAFNAPPELVYQVFTQARYISRWYAPSFVKLVSCQSDTRIGGSFEYILQDADQNDLRYTGTWLELQEPTHVVYTEIFSMPGFTSPESRVRIDFVRQINKTLMRSLTRYDSKASRDAVIAAGVEFGAGESLNQAEAILAELLL